MNFFRRFYSRIAEKNVWARPNMPVTFRAEVMPGKSRSERTFLIEKVLPSGRVTLEGFIGEHRESAFEQINFKRQKS
jgi:hypothetical protein